MFDLDIDNNLIGLTKSFLHDRWVELVIDRHINPKYNVEIEIPQRSLVPPNLFLIYISRVFLEIKSHLPQITCLPFLDDLRFFIAGNSAIEIKKLLEKARNITLDWEMCNTVTYYISKIKVILFFKARKQKLLEQLTITQLRFGGQTIRLNPQAT